MVRSEDLTKAQRDALDAIVLGKLAWSPAAEIEAAGHDHAVLEELVQLELAVWWTLAGSPQITLTPYGAWMLRVHIIEKLSIIGEELEEDPYWIDVIREASSIVLPKRRHEVRWPWMDEVEDPKAKGPEILEDDEGEPVLVMGRPVPIDRRMKGKAKAKQRRAG